MKLLLKNPLKHLLVSQKFGVNGLPIYNEQGLAGHNGTDFITGFGTEVYASTDGMAYYQIDSAGGHGVIVITSEQFEYKGEQIYFKTIYWHLIDPIKHPEYESPIQDFPLGKQVKAGDIIGYADSTGLSTGNHLHFGLKPLKKINDNLYQNIEQENGYFGAINPEPYLEGATVVKDFFLKDLKLNMVHPDVMRLQVWLNKNGYPLTATGIGSTGHETANFGKLTLGAVKRFQGANNLPQTGYFGPLSRAVINKIN